MPPFENAEPLPASTRAGEFVAKAIVYQLPNGHYYIVLEDWCGREFMFTLACHVWPTETIACKWADKFVGETLPCDMLIYFVTDPNWVKSIEFKYGGREE